jgi:hypothetical protein
MISRSSTTCRSNLLDSNRRDMQTAIAYCLTPRFIELRWHRDSPLVLTRIITGTSTPPLIGHSSHRGSQCPSTIPTIR